MQWLIDIVLASLKGMIVAWSGAIVNIPSGWVLCDGNNSTPDLRDRFIIAAGSSYNPNDSGGAATHIHSLADSHYHAIPSGTSIAAGSNFAAYTDQPAKKAETSSASSLSPYYALAFIMKS